MLRQGLDILLVDDDEACLATLEDALEQDGHRILTASRGLEALDRARRAGSAGHACQLTILDVHMPDLSGPETFDELVGVWPDLSAIFVSGRMDEALVRSTRATGVLACLEKPFDLHEMRRLVGRLSGEISARPGRPRPRPRNPWREPR
ncbi:MAG TPA: response regulator [Planctomycetota bacterium]|nr:response regulator [Planctomycetota bacterium]